MDPLSALSVAASAVQFLDFSLKLISGTVQRYQSTSGTSNDNLDLESTTKRIYYFVNQVELSVREPTDVLDYRSRLEPGNRNSPTFISPGSDSRVRKERSIGREISQHSKHDSEIVAIVQRCKDLASQLLKFLDELKVKGKFKLVKSILMAAKSVGNEGKAQNLRQRLFAAQSELSLWLIATVNDDQSKSMLRLLDIADHIDQTNAHQADLLLNLRASLLNELQLKSHMTEEALNLVVSLFQETHKAQSQLRFLESLRYPTMTRRESSIPTAHKQTFDWILKQSSDAASAMFCNWLEKGTGIYWATDKPGSGKSTLMKYISKHASTMTYLTKWAGPGSRLIVASHFFWIGGSELEKQQEGMLRTLLAMILTQLPEIMQQVAPDRWANELRQGQPWTRMELFDTFRRVMEQVEVQAKFCLFIDGLDEYAGDHDEIARLIKELASLPHAKICVACREWPIFEYHFGNEVSQPLVRKIHLQDFTKPDIQNYITDKLMRDDRFPADGHLEFHGGEVDTQLQTSSEEFAFMQHTLEGNGCSYHDLAVEITDRAQGVFLWVYLVCIELLKGLTNGDSLDMLQTRLRSLPIDLEDYLMVMINRIDKLYHLRCARILSLLSSANGPLEILSFQLLEVGNFDSVFKAPIQELPHEVLKAQRKRLAVILCARGTDLIEIINNDDDDDNDNYLRPVEPPEGYKDVLSKRFTIIYYTKKVPKPQREKDLPFLYNPGSLIPRC